MYIQHKHVVLLLVMEHAINIFKKNVSNEEKNRGIQMISMEVRGMCKVNIRNQYSIRDSVTSVQCRVLLNLWVLFP